MTPAASRTPAIRRRTLLAILVGAGAVGRLGRLKAEDRMAEDPGSWDRLTGSLAAVDLGDPHWAWAFLAVQRLVRDRPPDREQFLRLLAAEQAFERTPGRPIGGTLEYRLANALRDAGLTTPTADLPDPHGKIAKERHKIVLGWVYTP